MTFNTTVRGGSALVQRLTATSQRSANLGLVPDGMVSLAVGEPFAGTPSVISEAAAAALRRGRTRYAPRTGAPDLRAALAGHLIRAADVAVEPEQVVLVHGASAGLAAVILSVVDPGDRVVIPEPTYSLYADHVSLAGGSVAWVAHAPDGRLDLEAIEAEITGARAIVLCNPGNPTGRVIPRQDLEAVAALAAIHGVALVVDEAYADIVFDGIRFHSALNLSGPDAIFCVRTFSKSYAMTGWRLGYVVAPAVLADRVNRIHHTFNGPLNTFVQDAALAALELPFPFLSDMAAAYEQRRDTVVDRLSDLPYLAMARPEGAFYAFPRVDSTHSSKELAVELAARGGVLVRSGSEFGPSGEGHLRLSFATDLPTLEEGLDRFVAALPSLLR
jgi:aspartate aminotransferase